MENKNVVLSDDELKDVSGGAGSTFKNTKCSIYKTKEDCYKNVECAWVGDTCVEGSMTKSA